MPARSKFTAERRQIVIEHLTAGFSRRRAAAAAQIDHQTLARWIKRGETGAPGGRWAEFHRAVTLAEDASTPPILVALKAQQRDWERDSLAAWKFVELNEPGFARRPDPEPVKVEVVHSPTISKGDPA